MIKGFITVFMFFLFANVLYANTYIWTGSTSKNFTVSTNWSPSRITPAITDTLQFITTDSVTNVPIQTINTLLISNASTNVTLIPSKSGNTLTITTSLVVVSGNILDVTSIKLTGGVVPSGLGTLKTANFSSTPLPLDVNWSLSIIYYGTPAVNTNQYIERGLYSNLTINTVLSGTGNIVFPSAGVTAMTISGSFRPNATFGTGGYTFANQNSAGIGFTGTGTQTIPAFPYRTLAISGARGTNTVTLSGNIGISQNFKASATFTGQGGYVTTGSTITLNGTAPQTISAFNFNNLTISNSGGGVSLSGSTTIAGILTLKSGRLALGNYNLTLSNAPIGANDSSYVTTYGTGYLTIASVGNNATVFPVGTSSAYTPIIFTNTTNTPNISVSVDTTLTSPPTSTNNIVNLQWTIFSNIPSTSDVGFQYNNSNEGSGFVNTGAVLGIYTNVYNETNITNVTGSNPFIATKNSLALQTNISLYAIADSNQLNPQVFNDGTTPVTLVGTSYLERADTMIGLWSKTHPIGGELKQMAPYYWCKIYSNNERQYAMAQLDSIFDYVQATRSYSDTSSSVYDSASSNINFAFHSVMHGYLVTKNFLDDATKSRVLTFIQGWDLTKYINAAASVNMRMNLAASEFLASEEWPNITDSLGHTASQIQAATKPFVLRTLTSFFHGNCPQADATTYFSTNIPYVRMLAEFAVDKDVKQAAVAAYQYMIASLIPAWNNGLYVATPSANKSWGDLITGTTSSSNLISALAWLYFGNKTNLFTMIPVLSAHDRNDCQFVFWCAYQRNIVPLPSLQATYNSKQYPCEQNEVILDSFSHGTYTKYTYQSQNYGLATETEQPFVTRDAFGSWVWGSKRNYLAWQTDSAECVFSVCQDHSIIPYTLAPGPAGYGENPYQRVMQYKKAAIGIYNVDTSYFSGSLYKLFVPFTRSGIKTRIESAGWVYCNTGSMLFAFRTIEPYQWNNPKNPSRFVLPGYDMLTLADTTQRRGGWILETSEIPSSDLGLNSVDQLKHFITKMQSTVSFDTMPGYSTAPNPEFKYHSLDGDVLDLTFFTTNVVYNNNYKVNGTPIPITPQYIFKNPFMSQLHLSDSLFLIGGKDTLINGKRSVLNYNNIGSTYLQDFNSLPNSNLYQDGYYTAQGPFELMNQGFKTIGGPLDGNNLVTPKMDGWQVYKTTASGISGIEAENGYQTDGYLKSYGDSASADRSLGLLNTTSLNNAFGLIIRNNTSKTLKTCRISYLGKQWRISDNSTKQVLKCSYKLIKGAALGNGINQTGLTDIPALRFESPNIIDSIGAINGNNPANQKQVNTILNSLNWLKGDYLVIRFDDSLINSHGMAIDNFTFEADTILSLPLKLISFTGVLNKGFVTLKWNTANEQDIAGFDIERSDDDEVNFNTVGKVQSKNQSINEYKFNDDNLSKLSKTYYRIKIINQDGSFSYSNEILINNSALGNDFSIMPNPFKDYLLVQGNSLNTINIEIFDGKGKLVKRIPSCQTSSKIQVGDLKEGIYWVRITDEGTGKSMTQKLIKNQ